MTDRALRVAAADRTVRLIAVILCAMTVLSSAHAENSQSELPKVTVFKSPEAGIFSNAYLVETVQHVDVALLEWERGYLERYRREVASLAHGGVTLSDDDKKPLVQAMETYLPSKKLEFLIALGGDPVAAELKAESR